MAASSAGVRRHGDAGRARPAAGAGIVEGALPRCGRSAFCAPAPPPHLGAARRLARGPCAPSGAWPHPLPPPRASGPEAGGGAPRAAWPAAGGRHGDHPPLLSSSGVCARGRRRGRVAWRADRLSVPGRWLPRGAGAPAPAARVHPPPLPPPPHPPSPRPGGWDPVRQVVAQAPGWRGRRHGPAWRRCPAVWRGHRRRAGSRCARSLLTRRREPARGVGARGSPGRLAGGRVGERDDVEHDAVQLEVLRRVDPGDAGGRAGPRRRRRG